MVFVFETMPGCAVARCVNYSDKTKGTGIIYHSIPWNPLLQKYGSQNANAKNVNVLNARVCSQHFTADDYVRDLKAELLNLPPKMILKPDAVPSMNIPVSYVNENNIRDSFSSDFSENIEVPEMSVAVDTPHTSTERSNRCHQREVRKRALETMETLSPKKRKVVMTKLVKFKNIYYFF